MFIINIAGEELIIHLLKLTQKSSQKMNFSAICYILSRIEFQNNLHYSESILAQYRANKIIYKMMQNCDNMNVIAAGILVLAEMIDCDDSGVILQLIDDEITYDLQNQLNKILHLNKIRKSTLKILINSSLFILNLSQQEQIMYAADEIDLINNIILCIFRCVFNLLITNDKKGKEIKYKQVQDSITVMLRNMSCCMIWMYKNQHEVCLQLILKIYMDNNQDILIALLKCILYKDSTVRYYILDFISYIAMDDDIQVKIFMEYGILKYGLLKIIKKLLNADEYECTLQRLILKIIANVCDPIKFGNNEYRSIIVNDDDFLYLISNGLRSRNCRQCINAVFTVNNILSSDDQLLIKRLLYWKEAYIIWACSYFISNYNEVVISQYNKRGQSVKTWKSSFKSIGKLIHLIVKLCQMKTICTNYIHYRLYECSWMEAIQNSSLVISDNNVIIPNKEYLRLIDCEEVASDIEYMIRILNYMENCDDESWNKIIADVFSDSD